MASRRSSISRTEAAPLRRGGGGTEFTHSQLLQIAVFAAALVGSGEGVYLKGSADGTNVRIKVYQDDEQYQDNLNARDDLVYLLDDYAKQLKVEMVFKDIMRLVHAASRPEASSAAEEAGGQPKVLRKG